MQSACRFLFLCLMLLLLTGCTGQVLTQPTLVPAVDPSVPQQRSTLTAPAGPSLTPTVVQPQVGQSSPTLAKPTATQTAVEAGPTLTLVPLAQPLPAPLYFIKQQFVPDGKPPQIWKLTADGSAAYPVTVEAGKVDENFDVSGDGKLAYISQNQLIVADAEGKNRRVLVEGKAPPAQRDAWWYLREEIKYPAWSPDGKRIAYFQAGVNVIDVASGKVTLIAEDKNTFVEKDGGKQAEDINSVQAYIPIGWTPDGTRILLSGQGTNVGMFIILAQPGGQMIQVEALFSGQNLAGCCDYSFTADGKMLFSHGTDRWIGLWLIDPNTGKGKNLTVPRSDVEFPGAGIFLPKQASDGRIFFFTPNRSESPKPPFPLGYVDGKKSPFQAPEDVTFIQSDGQCFEPQGGLWFPDASRVIMHGDGERLCIMNAATGAGTLLEINAASLHWGAAE